MHKVININLNGNAYQLDEDAYLALQAYLDRAQTALRNNPDKTEILGDLEQAIAEKCSRFLNPQKTVVSKSEIDQIITEMGPVEAANESAPGDGEPRESSEQADTPPKRLYRVTQGAMFMGVCAGLAAYFRVDVTLVRILFVIAAFATSGVAILLYIVMTIVVPEANTSEEHAAAYGLPFNAQELVDQAKKKADFATRRWRREWRRKQRDWRREWRTEREESRWRVDYVPGAVFAGIMTPIFGVINLALFVFLAWIIYSLSTTGSVSGWTIPPEMPFWVAVMIVVGLYLVITSPLSAARHVSHRAYGHHPAFAVISGIIWLGVVAFAIYLGSQHVSEIREFVETLPAVWNDIRLKLQNRP